MAAVFHLSVARLLTVPSLLLFLVIKMKTETILGMVSILTLLFLALPVASAGIEILDVGIGYDGLDYYGYADYQNTENYNMSGVISVFIDGNVVAEKTLDMPVRYVAGFRCSPIKTVEFPLRMPKGNHTIVVCALSQNISVERSYEYSMRGWEDEPPDEETELELEEDDWLQCSRCGK